MTLTASDEQQIVFETRRRDLPTPVPESWLVEDLSDKKVKVTISADIATTINTDIPKTINTDNATSVNPDIDT